MYAPPPPPACYWKCCCVSCVLNMILFFFSQVIIEHLTWILQLTSNSTGDGSSNSNISVKYEELKSYFSQYETVMLQQPQYLHHALISVYEKVNESPHRTRQSQNTNTLTHPFVVATVYVTSGYLFYVVSFFCCAVEWCEVWLLAVLF